MGGKPFKICHVLSRFETGGLENGVANLCNHHDRAQFQPFICCVKDSGAMKARLRSDVRVDILGAPEGKDFTRPLRLAKYFRRTRPDVVHTHGWQQCSFDGIIGARLAGVPVVINGEHGTFATKTHQIVLQRLLALLCNVTLSVSHAHKQKVVEALGISSRHINVIHNGVDTSRFTGTHDVSELVRTINSDYSTHIDENTFVVGCIGSIKPIKNQQLLVNAAAELLKRLPSANFIVLFVGQGPDVPMLKALSASLGVSNNLLFLGERTDIPELLSLMDVLVLPSQTGKEGLPNVVLEAFASMVPVISTRSVGTNEIMIENETGWFLANEDPAELCERIIELMKEPEKLTRMSEAARRHILSKYTLKIMVNQYERQYMRFFTGNN